jgi:hypothetical protein
MEGLVAQQAGRACTTISRNPLCLLLALVVLAWAVAVREASALEGARTGVGKALRSLQLSPVTRLLVRPLDPRTPGSLVPTIGEVAIGEEVISAITLMGIADKGSEKMCGKS